MSDPRQASAMSVFLLEELGDARLRCSQLKKYLEEATTLIDASQNREHFFEVAGHLLYGIPDTLMKMEKALHAAAMAAARWDYEDIKDDLLPEKADQLEAALEDVRVRRVRRQTKEATDRIALMVDRSDSAFKVVLLPMLRQETLKALESVMADIMVDLARTRAGHKGKLSDKLSLYKPDEIEMSEWIDHVEEAMEAWFSTQKRSLRQAKETPMKTQEAAAQLELIASTIDETGQIDTQALSGLILALEGAGNQKTASSKREIATALRTISASLLDNTDPTNRPSRLSLAAALRRVLGDTLDVNERTAASLKIKNRLHGEGLDTNDVIEALKQAANNLYDCRGETRPINQTLEDIVTGAGAGIGPLAGMPDGVYAIAKRARGEWNEADRYIGVVASTMEVLARDMKKAKPDASKRYDKTASDETTQDEPEEQSKEASDKVARTGVEEHMRGAFDEGFKDSRGNEKDLKQAADRLAKAAKNASTQPLQLGMLAKAPIGYFNEISDCVSDLAFEMGALSAAGKKQASDEKESRFEEGKPADPTEEMSEEAAKEWKANTDKYEDKFKTASDEKESRFEEGKPADPTENMSEEDAKQWKVEHDKNKDNFKAAMEHSSPEAMKDYFREHPGADRKKHHVVDKMTGESKGRGDQMTSAKPSKELAQSIKQDWVGSKHDNPNNPVTGVMKKMERGEAVSSGYLNKAIMVLKNVSGQSGITKAESEKLWNLSKKLKEHAQVKEASDEKESRFEEGKPADPTENMSEDDAKQWKIEHDKNKDKFKKEAFEMDSKKFERVVLPKMKNVKTPEQYYAAIEELFEAHKISQQEFRWLEEDADDFEQMIKDFKAEGGNKNASSDPWKV